MYYSKINAHVCIYSLGDRSKQRSLFKIVLIIDFVIECCPSSAHPSVSLAFHIFIFSLRTTGLIKPNLAQSILR